MKRSIVLASALVALQLPLLLGCAKDISNKEDVRVAVVDYLTKRAESTGLNVASMDVQVASVSFEKDQAQAVVSITPKGMKDGMQLTYALVRKGDKWEVKGKQDSGSNPHGGPGGATLPPPPASSPHSAGTPK